MDSKLVHLEIPMDSKLVHREIPMDSKLVHREIPKVCRGVTEKSEVELGMFFEWHPLGMMFEWHPLGMLFEWHPVPLGAGCRVGGGGGLRY